MDKIMTLTLLLFCTYAEHEKTSKKRKVSGTECRGRGKKQKEKPKGKQIYMITTAAAFVTEHERSDI